MGCEVRVHVFIWYILRPEEVKIADLVPKGAAVALGTEAQAESFQQTPVLYVCAAIGMLRLFLHDLPTAFSQISLQVPGKGFRNTYNSILHALSRLS